MINFLLIFFGVAIVAFGAVGWILFASACCDISKLRKRINLLVTDEIIKRSLLRDSKDINQRYN